LNSCFVFCSSTRAQHDANCRDVQSDSAAQPNASASVAVVQHEHLNFDDIPDTLPSRRDVETGAITEAEVSATGWIS